MVLNPNQASQPHASHAFFVSCLRVSVVNFRLECERYE
jgi:hypothetical protein